MGRYKIVTDGVVTNIIEASAAFAATLVATPAGNVGIGWVKDGDTFVAPPELPAPVPVPEPTGAQCKIALFEAGLLDDVEALIAAHPYRPVQLWYAAANTWRRDNPYVAALGLELGLSDDELDGLFRAASLKT